MERESVGTEILNLPLGRKTTDLSVVEKPESDKVESADDELDTAADTDCEDTSEYYNVIQ